MKLFRTPNFWGNKTSFFVACLIDMVANNSTLTVPLDKPILLFDGVCNLCNSSVQTVIKLDKNSEFRLASLQSEVGQMLLEKFNLPMKDLNTVVLIDKNKAYLRSDVPLEVMRQLGRGWQLFYIFKIVPRFIRDGVYNFIASNRYRWFGKEEACWLPSPEIRQRFLG